MLQELTRLEQSPSVPGLKEAINVLEKFVLKGGAIRPHPLAKVLYFWYEDYYQREIPVEVKDKKYNLTVSTQPYFWERGHALKLALSNKRGQEVGSLVIPKLEHLYLYSNNVRMGLKKLTELLEEDVLPLLREQIAKDEAWTPDVV